jgi:hypothetical protein
VDDPADIGDCLVDVLQVKDIPSGLAALTNVETNYFSPTSLKRQCKSGAYKTSRSGDQDSLVHVRPPIARCELSDGV